MTNSARLLLITLALTATFETYASGQRTTIVNTVNIEKYLEIKLSGKSLVEPVLHYIGTVGTDRHLLMVTKTSLPPKQEVSPGVFKVQSMPWDHVFRYHISSEETTVINGWDISGKLAAGGFEVRPSYCPKIHLNLQQKEYRIMPDPEVKSACLNMRRPLIRR